MKLPKTWQNSLLPVLCLPFLTGAGALCGEAPVSLYPLQNVRLTGGPFARAVEANREYLLAHDPDRLLAPFLREAGLEPRAESYENWENTGLDGHTAGHYLSALAMMIASGDDDQQGTLAKRLDHMVNELARCQEASGDGYLGGIPGGPAMWKDVAAGKIEAHGFGLNGKWVPWYNLHKTFAGLRDAYLFTGNEKAREVLVRYGDWVDALCRNLTDEDMQDMLQAEHGGMNEVLADISAITGESKYLDLAKRFNHHAILDPLVEGRDELTGKHANTQIPKVIGLERIAALTGDERAEAGAEFFWQTVTGKRSVAFGGNSVSEHFNDPSDFSGVLSHREGPETCNTYNMLRLTEMLFSRKPDAAYADYYERALYNHILSSINCEHPGYVYFTPLRPRHYRVYSQPEQGFWCCVGSGMENPGKYGRFIYAGNGDSVYVNLFIPSILEDKDKGLVLKQQTRFPYDSSSRLVLSLEKPAAFALKIRHPSWADGFVAKVNGEVVAGDSGPSSYLSIQRDWQDGDTVEIALPMATRVEALPDGSDWYAIMHGPILMAAPSGKDDLEGLRAGKGRGDHVARGPEVPLNEAPVLVTTPEELPDNILSTDSRMVLAIDSSIVAPDQTGRIRLQPFFSLHDSRYQIYWNLVSPEEKEARQQEMAAAEKARQELAARTLDSVAIGEQQPEVDHAFLGVDSETGVHEGRRWRHGKSFQYTLNARGAGEADLVVTYWGGDAGRAFDLFANDTLLATEELKGDHPGTFFDKSYRVPPAVLKESGGEVTVKFVARQQLAGGIFDLRLMKVGE